MSDVNEKELSGRVEQKQAASAMSASGSPRASRRPRRRSGHLTGSDDPSAGDSSSTDLSPVSSTRCQTTAASENAGTSSQSPGTSMASVKSELAYYVIMQMEKIAKKRSAILEGSRTDDGSGKLPEANFSVEKDLQLDKAYREHFGDANPLLSVLANASSLWPMARTPHTSSAVVSPRNSNASPAKLPPITIKVEDVGGDSRSASYADQQPSTSSALTASQSAVSLLGAAQMATPRASSVVGAESNVERAAKQEAQVLARVAELRRQGLWTAARLPMIEMPARNKTHWDYLLEEMRWMAIDFRQERNFKRHAAKKFAVQIARIVRDKEMEKERAAQRAVKEAKRVCAVIAKMVRDFWQNVDKVVEHRAQEIIESVKRKALDQQLELMVGHANKLSELVQEGLQGERPSRTPSVHPSEEDHAKDDADFVNKDVESDDESTIAKEEEIMGTNVDEEMAELEKDSQIELDDLLDSLPAGYLESLGLAKPETSVVTANAASTSHVSDEEDSEDSTDEEKSEATSSTVDEESSVEKQSADGEKLDETPSAGDDFGSSVQPTVASESQSGSSTSHKDGDGESVPASEEASKDAMDSIDFERLTSDSSEVRQKELANIAEQALKFQPKGFTLETTQVKTAVPHLIRGVLREYQMVGLDWLVTLYEKGLNGILADEMGLGKTIQTIALLAHLACKDANWGPHLIVVPTSVILNWEMELKKWCPAFKILTYFGSQKERQEKRRGWSKPNAFHVCVTSYKIVTLDIRSFKHKAWQYFILDEAQNIKNFKSQRWQMLLNVRARRRLLLTGTPLQNSLMELWSLMHFLMPAIFASHNDFKDWFSNPLNDMMEGNTEWNAPLVQRLHKVLRPFILRRLKAEVEKQLPEKTEHIIKCCLSKRQRCLYDDFMSRRSTRENLRSGSVMSVLNIVMQLRKCCNHPNLFEPRPVVSPFAVHPLCVVMPATLLDICERASLPCGAEKAIPECLRLDRLLRGSQMARVAENHLAVSKALIEEVSSQDDVARIPRVDGFTFVRPPPPAKMLRQPQSADGSAGISAPVSVGSGNFPSDGELYVCVDNGTARLYKMMTTSSGERTIQEFDRIAVGGGGPALGVQPVAASAPGGVAAPIVGFPSPRADAPKTEPPDEDTDVKPSTSGAHSDVNAATLRTAVSSESSMNPALRARTVLNQVRIGAQPKQEAVSARNGCTSAAEPREAFPAAGTLPSQARYATMSSSRTSGRAMPVVVSALPPSTAAFTNGVLPNASSSPPPKRRRLTAPKIDRQPYSELILPETRASMRDQRDARLTYVGRRCAPPNPPKRHRVVPLVSDELLSHVRASLKKTRVRKRLVLPDGLLRTEVDRFPCTMELNWASGKLRSFTEDLLQRFMVFVHGALSDAPVLRTSTLGRAAYFRNADALLEEQCAQVVSDVSELVAESMLMQRIQFPELRLIEYDCGKLQVLSGLLRDLFLYKHRCLIFTQMSRMLDVLQSFLSFHGYQYFRLDGSTSIEQRQSMMERFNADPRIFCFILSTRSGGLGVNLTGADTVIFYDSDWNPTMDAQAQDRCHRIGQTRNVTIYRLISEKTIEENILRKAMQKRRLGEMAIDEGSFTPEFFKGDNLRDLFDGDDAARDLVSPINVRDTAEIEKAMATLEDVQDVAAAKRANAEAKAELAEFDESQHAFAEGISEKADSKYFELLNQLKPIERYAINFLEAEYKPDLEEEVKEAKAMFDSKKDEWLKAHETVIERGDEEGDGEFDLTYANGLGMSGTVDEVRSKQPAGRAQPTRSSKRASANAHVTTPPLRSSRRLSAPAKRVSPRTVSRERRSDAATRTPSSTSSAIRKSSSTEPPRKIPVKRNGDCQTTPVKARKERKKSQEKPSPTKVVAASKSSSKNVANPPSESSEEPEERIVIVDDTDDDGPPALNVATASEVVAATRGRGRPRKCPPSSLGTEVVLRETSPSPLPVSRSSEGLPMRGIASVPVGPTFLQRPSTSSASAVSARSVAYSASNTRYSSVAGAVASSSQFGSAVGFPRFARPSFRDLSPAARTLVNGSASSVAVGQQASSSQNVVRRYMVTTPVRPYTSDAPLAFSVRPCPSNVVIRAGPSPRVVSAASGSIQRPPGERGVVSAASSGGVPTSASRVYVVRGVSNVASSLGGRQSEFRAVSTTRGSIAGGIAVRSSPQTAVRSSPQVAVRSSQQAAVRSSQQASSSVASSSSVGSGFSLRTGYSYSSGSASGGSDVLKPSLGDYERPRLFLRKRADPTQSPVSSSRN